MIGMHYLGLFVRPALVHQYGAARSVTLHILSRLIRVLFPLGSYELYIKIKKSICIN